MKLQATPNLFRAVAECTQPYGPPASGASVRLLQSYLNNDRCIDSVYKAILARAIAEPQSEAVISRCIALIKQYVSRYTPSAAVLEAIAVACQRLAESLPADSGLQKSLVYLESSVARLAGSTLAGRTLAHLHSRSTNSSSPRPWLQAAVNGDISKGRTGGGSFSAQSSTSADDSQSRLGARGSFEQVQQQGYGAAGLGLQQQQQLRQHDEEAEEADLSDADGENEQQLAVQGAVRPVPPQGVLPDWTFQPSALQELWCHQPDINLGELDWSIPLPQYSPSLVPLVEGLPGMEVLHMLSSQDIIEGITDSDVQTQLRQMREITEVRRVQAGVTPELLQQALQQSSTSKARRLFQPLPYTHQDPIEMTSTDVAAVVEIMCGKPSPAAPSAITGTVGLDDPSMYWQQRAGQQQQQQPLLMLYQQPGQQQQQLHTESIGQISSCILVKLIVDLWLSAGGATAFPLVLRMLQQALYQSQAEYRASAFDIIYNLSLHGTMLMPAQPSRPGSPAAPYQQGANNEAAHSSLMQQQQYQQELQQLALLQRMQPTQPRYGAAAGGRDQGSPGSMCSDDEQNPSSHGSPKSQGPGSTGHRSTQSSPRIHLPPQLLAPQQSASPKPQQATATPQLGSSSPLPSPKGRSRLSRSELRVTAEQQRRSSSSFRGSGGGAAAADEDEAVATAEAEGVKQGSAGADRQLPVELTWEAWLQQLLCELLLMLAMLEEPCEQVWQSALGCLLHLTTHAGHWVASSLHFLPPAAAAALLDACIQYNWSQELHSRLVQMAVNLLYVTDPAPPAVSGAGAAEVGVADSSAKPQQGPRARSPGRWHRLEKAAGHHQRQQLQHSESEQESSDDGDLDNQPPSAAERVSIRSSVSSFQRRAQQVADLDLPCQLHAGPVDESQLLAFGGASKLLKHFCHAGSIEAQRTLLVPLLQVLMPADAPDASQLAILQTLCSNPNCLAALQVTLAAGLPGWADPILSAITELMDEQQLDLQLLAAVLLRLEDLALSQMHGAGLGGVGTAGLQEAADTAAVEAAGGLQDVQQGQPGEDAEGLGGIAAVLGGAVPTEVQTAMQVTIRHMAGQLPAQPQFRAGPDGAEVVVYQVQPEVQGAWKSLKALCWCDDDLARHVVQHWLQQLLAVTLQQSLKNVILLPLPGVAQRASTPSGDIHSTATSQQHTRAASDTDAATTVSLRAACDAWVEVLQQLVTHCPQGPGTLVDALQLHITTLKLQSSRSIYDLGARYGAAAAVAGTSPAAVAPEHDREQQLKQRAAVARNCVQAWGFVCQWVMQAKIANSQAALTRLAGIAQSLACVPEVPDWVEAAVAGGVSGDVGAPTGTAAGIISSRDKLLSSGGTAGFVGTKSEAGSDLALPMPPTVGLSRDDELGFKGVPPPEPSSEPSSLAALWASEIKSGAEAEQVAGTNAAAAEAEAVSWPQAFLLGRALMPQQMAQVLAGSSLALLLVRLLQCKQPNRAADRGFLGRPCSSSCSSVTDGGNWCSSTAGIGGVCPVLYPWSDGRQDLQLGLLFILMTSCAGDAGSFADFGLEAVTQQVLSRCTDPRACLLVSQFMLEHLMRHQQNQYWTALRQLVTTAQQQDDERLLGNPFLQVVTLLSQLQQQRPPSSAAVSPGQASGGSGRGGS